MDWITIILVVLVVIIWGFKLSWKNKHMDELEEDENMHEKEQLNWEDCKKQTIFGKHYAFHNNWVLSVPELDLFYENGWEYIDGTDEMGGTLFKKRNVEQNILEQMNNRSG